MLAHGLADPVGHGVGGDGEPDVGQGLEQLGGHVVGAVLVADHGDDRHLVEGMRPASSASDRNGPIRSVTRLAIDDGWPSQMGGRRRGCRVEDPPPEPGPRAAVPLVRATPGLMSRSATCSGPSVAPPSLTRASSTWVTRSSVLDGSSPGLSVAVEPMAWRCSMPRLLSRGRLNRGTHRLPHPDFLVARGPGTVLAHGPAPGRRSWPATCWPTSCHAGGVTSPAGARAELFQPRARRSTAIWSSPRPGCTNRLRPHVVDTGSYALDGASATSGPSMPTSSPSTWSPTTPRAYHAAGRRLAAVLEDEFPLDPALPHDELLYCDQTTNLDGARRRGRAPRRGLARRRHRRRRAGRGGVGRGVRRVEARYGLRARPAARRPAGNFSRAAPRGPGRSGSPPSRSSRLFGVTQPDEEM